MLDWRLNNCSISILWSVIERFDGLWQCVMVPASVLKPFPL
jgi:hypothetical protein